MKPMLLICASGIVVAAILSLATWRVQQPHDDQIVAYPAGYMLAVNFAHADHTGQDCVACHHNFIDDSGGGLCFDCHKTDPQVSPLIEDQFHDLCRGCHLNEQALAHEHGPTRACIACHVKDDSP